MDTAGVLRQRKQMGDQPQRDKGLRTGRENQHDRHRSVNRARLGPPFCPPHCPTLSAHPSRAGGSRFHCLARPPLPAVPLGRCWTPQNHVQS